MATLRMIDGSTVSIPSTTVSDFKGLWQEALRVNVLLVLGDGPAIEALVNPNHIMTVSQ